jgi:hypothetical protein
MSDFDPTEPSEVIMNRLKSLNKQEIQEEYVIDDKCKYKNATEVLDAATSVTENYDDRKTIAYLIDGKLYRYPLIVSKSTTEKTTFILPATKRKIVVGAKLAFKIPDLSK